MAIATQHQFLVTIDNVIVSFAKISNMEKSMEYEVLSEGGNNLSPRLLPLPQKQVKTLRMERGIQENIIPLFRFGPGTVIKTGIGIAVLDAGNRLIARYKVEGTTVVKWEMGALDAQSNGVLLETFEVTYTNIKREL